MVRDNKQKCWNVFGVSKPHYTDMEIKPGDDNLRCISIQKISQYPSVSLHFHLSTEKFPWKCLCYLDHYSKMHFFSICPPEFRCSCPVLYFGSRCENGILPDDPCASQPCANGLCMPNNQGYICNCSAQIAGNRWDSHSEALEITHAYYVLGEGIEKSD